MNIQNAGVLTFLGATQYIHLWTIMTGRTETTYALKAAWYPLPFLLCTKNKDMDKNKAQIFNSVMQT